MQLNGKQCCHDHDSTPMAYDTASIASFKPAHNNLNDCTEFGDDITIVVANEETRYQPSLRTISSMDTIKYQTNSSANFNPSYAPSDTNKPQFKLDNLVLMMVILTLLIGMITCGFIFLIQHEPISDQSNDSYNVDTSGTVDTDEIDNIEPNTQSQQNLDIHSSITILISLSDIMNHRMHSSLNKVYKLIL